MKRTRSIACAALLLVIATALRAQDSAGGVSAVQISREGRQVYEEVCQACHMADARGGGGAGAGIPALAGNPRLADKAFVIDVLVKGRGGMPWFTDILSAGQIAAVLTYVRSDFNPYSDPVTVQDVEEIAGSAGETVGE
jgi:mono/diheme cytochrome c family protein